MRRIPSDRMGWLRTKLRVKKEVKPSCSRTISRPRSVVSSAQPHPTCRADSATACSRTPSLALSACRAVSRAFAGWRGRLGEASTRSRATNSRAISPSVSSARTRAAMSFVSSAASRASAGLARSTVGAQASKPASLPCHTLGLARSGSVPLRSPLEACTPTEVAGRECHRSARLATDTGGSASHSLRREMNRLGELVLADPVAHPIQSGYPRRESQETWRPVGYRESALGHRTFRT